MSRSIWIMTEDPVHGRSLAKIRFTEIHDPETYELREVPAPVEIIGSKAEIAGALDQIATLRKEMGL